MHNLLFLKCFGLEVRSDHNMTHESVNDGDECIYMYNVRRTCTMYIVHVQQGQSIFRDQESAYSYHTNVHIWNFQ